MKIVFTDEADADLVAIIQYISERHPAAARDLPALFDERLKTLAEYPLIGRDRSNLKPGLRSIVSQNYVVFYRVRKDAILISRIFDGRRDVDEEFFH
jgi:toxin ParE1/3/4